MAVGDPLWEPVRQQRGDSQRAHRHLVPEKTGSVRAPLPGHPLAPWGEGRRARRGPALLREAFNPGGGLGELELPNRQQDLRVPRVPGSGFGGRGFVLRGGGQREGAGQPRGSVSNSHPSSPTKRLHGRAHSTLLSTAPGEAEGAIAISNGDTKPLPKHGRPTRRQEGGRGVPDPQQRSPPPQIPPPNSLLLPRQPASPPPPPVLHALCASIASCQAQLANSPAPTPYRRRPAAPTTVSGPQTPFPPPPPPRRGSAEPVLQGPSEARRTVASPGPGPRPACCRLSAPLRPARGAQPADPSAPGPSQPGLRLRPGRGLRA